MVVPSHLLSLSAYIDQNLEKDLPLSNLAKRVGLSPFHFHRKFGAYFGESLHQHIKRLRLERAAFELTYGTRPVREIALASGYKPVSAFSHAFSGFAGESPTRYRNHKRLSGAANGSARKHDAPPAEPSDAATRPAWIGELAPQRLAFVRAAGHGHGAQASVREAVSAIVAIVEPTSTIEMAVGRGAHGARTSNFDEDGSLDQKSVRPIEFVASTTDFYGIVNGGNFRIDVGVDADRVPPDREKTLGMQTLPGGRYARFDFVCTPAELIGLCYRAATRGWRGASDHARTTAHFVRFMLPEQDAEGDRRSYRFFMPLTD
ncbi:MAG: helix-turn-helix domain-containing protein [Burkholderiaceae bacterium]